MGKEKAAYGQRREASYRAMCEQFAYELGGTLVEREGEIVLLHSDDSEEALPVEVGSRHPWFEAWKVLKERVPPEIEARVSRDSASGRL